MARGSEGKGWGGKGDAGERRRGAGSTMLLVHETACAMGRKRGRQGTAMSDHHWPWFGCLVPGHQQGYLGKLICPGDRGMLAGHHKAGCAQQQQCSITTCCRTWQHNSNTRSPSNYFNETGGSMDSH